MLKLDWQWVNIIKPPKIHTIPDILTPVEIEQFIGTTQKLRYRVFLLTTYSMGLRHIQALLGHASPTTTARYAHLTDVTEKDSMITINELINTLRVDLRKV